MSTTLPKKNKAQITKYQIRITDKRGCGHFLYFEAKDVDKEKVACKTANEDLAKRSENDRLYGFSVFHLPYKPIKTISVVEYDNEKKCPKRCGKKFKLRITFIEKRYLSGLRVRNEWYEAV